MRPQTIAVIGGGAAGFFAAIRCAECNPALQVEILERGRQPLEKVRISGGGRCNLTHACFDARALCAHYPRGSRELLGPFLRFGPADTVAWFEARGVAVKAEADGRMFPVSDDSMSVVRCLQREADRLGVVIRLQTRVERIAPDPAGGWQVWTNDGHPQHFERILVATGSSPAVWDMLAQLGHRIVPPVPSLFTFNTRDTRLRELAGVSVPAALLRIPALKLQASGPLLVTHWGLSGPAVLRLSAWGARLLHACNHRFTLQVHWASGRQVDQEVLAQKTLAPKRQVVSHPIAALPLRLWQNLCAAAGIEPGCRWADLRKVECQALSAQVGEGLFEIHGKSTFKEEFVTAGGVDLRDIRFQTFESRVCPGLFIAGEALDVDAITGGFNFQAAWTGGWIAGEAMAQGEGAA